MRFSIHPHPYGMVSLSNEYFNIIVFAGEKRQQHMNTAHPIIGGLMKTGKPGMGYDDATRHFRNTIDKSYSELQRFLE